MDELMKQLSALIIKAESEGRVGKGLSYFLSPDHSEVRSQEGDVLWQETVIVDAPLESKDGE